MTTDSGFRMAVRAGNWGVSVMLPFHKPVRVHLAPADAPNTLVGFEAPVLKRMPGDLTAAEIHSLTVADGEGRVVLKVDGRRDRAERNRIELMPEVWTLTLEGTKGQVTLYALDVEDFPSDEVLDALAARLGHSTPA